MTLSPETVDNFRRQFPALSRQMNGEAVAYLDGPAGTQVPQRVIDAISHYLAHMNANHEGVFATSRESDELLHEVHRAVGDLLGTDDPDTIAFGPNMTTLTFSLSRSLARTWQPGDEVVVTRLDHDANVTPWVLAAEDAGATIRFVDINRDDCTLKMDEFRSAITTRTKLVAVGCASNSTGGINPVREICQLAREVGALSFLDAVHFAPHARINVDQLGCDFLACSAYKFFGPHIGAIWGRRELLEELKAYKLRPAPDALPGKWMTGTQNHECLAGVLAAVEYLADLGRSVRQSDDLSRPEALDAAFKAIGEYERELSRRLISRLNDLPKITIHGISDLDRLDERLPTVSITHGTKSSMQLATELGERGFFVWNGNYYALQLTETLGLEPEGMVRLGFVHYNTTDEVDRLLATLAEL